MYKKFFPLLQQRNIHYLDAAATAQRPEPVLAGLREYYTLHNGNAGRGSHTLAIESAQLIEDARTTTARFIGADKPETVIFTKNATESLNIIAYCYAAEQLHEGDEILISIANHHANLIPWQYAAKKTGAVLKYVYLDADGNFDFADYTAKLTERTKIVAFPIAVNTTGVIFPTEEIIRKAHEAGAVAVADAAQSISHFPHTVQDWDCDFMVFSGHKMYAEFGVGVLYAKTALIDKMPPFLYGGSMIDFVTEQASEFKTGGQKYEGGTLNAAAIHSLKLSIDFIEGIGWEALHRWLGELDSYTVQALASLDFVETYAAKAAHRVPISAFNVKGIHSHDTAFILDSTGVMVRSGHHCTQPLMHYLGVPSCCRASLSLYNTKEDIDCLISGLKQVITIFNKN